VSQPVQDDLREQLLRLLEESVAGAELREQSEFDRCVGARASRLLLFGAGLLLKSFQKLQDVDPGFKPGHLLTMQISLPATKYKDPQQVDGFFQQALDKINALPGVQSAGVSTSVPMSGVNSAGSFGIEGRTTAPGEMAPWGNRWFAGASYFQTMGVPLIKGRYFDDRDVRNAPQVAIIDETMERKFWPDEDPIGKRIAFQRDAQGNPIWREVVGVVRGEPDHGLPALQVGDHVARTEVGQQVAQRGHRQALGPADVDPPEQDDERPALLGPRRLGPDPLPTHCHRGRDQKGVGWPRSAPRASTIMISCPPSSFSTRIGRRLSAGRNPNPLAKATARPLSVPTQ